MSQWEHYRVDGHLAAWKAINVSAAEDLKAQRGFIRPARTLFAYYDSKLHTLSERAADALQVLRWKKRA